MDTVNAHDALVEALEKLYQYTIDVLTGERFTDIEWPVNFPDSHPVLKQAATALNLARGRSEINTDTGGPAQPVTYQHPDLEGAVILQRWEGMTLLDYFAGQALAGIAAHHAAGTVSFDEGAKKCYTAAKAMIAEKRRLEK